MLAFLLTLCDTFCMTKLKDIVIKTIPVLETELNNAGYKYVFEWTADEDGIEVYLELADLGGHRVADYERFTQEEFETEKYPERDVVKRMGKLKQAVIKALTKYSSD